MHKQQTLGFTLLEMLIALAIFSVVSLTAGSLLFQAVETQNVSAQYGDRMIDLERGVSRLSRDLLQYVPREVRDELGDQTDAMIIAGGSIEFTRQGWPNPAGHSRSDLQRVQYSVDEGALQRHYWTVLDRAPESDTQTQMLIDNVSAVRFEPITATQVLRGDIYSTIFVTEEEEEPAIGIRVFLEVPGVGEFTRLIDLPEELPDAPDEDGEDALLDEEDEEDGAPEDKQGNGNQGGDRDDIDDSGDGKNA